jgi:hypothetical protein
MKAGSRDEFDPVKALHDARIESIEDSRDKTQYGRLSNKAGLVIEKDSIVIRSLDRSRKVSI